MMQPIVLRLKDEDRRLLELEAKQEGIAMAEVARKAIKAYFKEKPKQKSAGEVLLEWALRKDKPIKKSRVNSTNYKEYLYGSKSHKFGYLWRDKK